MGSEQKILEALEKLKIASAGVISRETGFSSAYVDLLCGSLIKSGKLTKVEGKYNLAGARKRAKKTRPPKLRRTSERRRRKRKEVSWVPEWLR